MPPTPTTTDLSATPTYNATISGNIKIGSFNIPINSAFPPKTGTELTLDYTYAEDDDHPAPPTGSIRDLATWFKDTFKYDLPVPDSFTAYGVQVLKLRVKASTEGIGNAEIETKFGKVSETTPSTFDDTWKPFGDTANFVVSGVTLDIKRIVA